jgi:AraC family transcriptional regulator
MKTSSRTEYLRRIDRVVEKLSACIEKGESLPSVAELAGHAHLSEFHFMRVYRALAGEALGATIQRLRLERAVHLLKATPRPIGDIAGAVGYETQQAFAKAFRQQFAAAPTDVRERPDAYSDTLTMNSVPRPASVIRVEIVQLAPFRVAALRNRGAYADLDQAYVRLFGWVQAQGALDAVRGIWGAPHHDRRDVPPEDSIFDCCLAIDADLAPSDGVHIEELGGGAYAVFRHIGSYARLDEAHDVLLRDVLPQAQLTLRDAPILHRFLNEPDVTPEAELETHIYLPIVQEQSC